MTRHAYVLPEQKLVVFWTPKAACSSVADAVARCLFSEHELSALNGDRGGPRVLLNERGFMKPGPVGRRFAERKGFKSMAVIREPYDRLISAYINKFVIYNHQPILSYANMEPFAFQFIRDNAKKLGLSRRPSVRNLWGGLSFRQFCSTVCDIIDETPEKSRVLNQHWNTQVPDSFMASNFDYDEVYILKNINQFFQKLGNHSKVKLGITKRNVSPYVPSARENFCDLSSLEILKKEGFSKRSFNDAGLRQRVRESFSVDYHYVAKAV